MPSFIRRRELNAHPVVAPVLEQWREAWCMKPDNQDGFLWFRTACYWYRVYSAAVGVVKKESAK